VSEQETQRNFLTACKKFVEKDRFKTARYLLRFSQRRKISRGVDLGSGDFPALQDAVTPGAKLLSFVAAQEFVALDGGNYADGAFVTRLRALDAAEAAYTDGPCQSDLVGQGEKNFNGRAFLHIFWRKK